MGHAFGDQYIKNAAHTLRRQLRNDVGVIVRSTSMSEAEKLHERVKAAVLEAGVQASTGIAMRLKFRTLTEALKVADARLSFRRQAQEPSATRPRRTTIRRHSSQCSGPSRTR